MSHKEDQVIPSTTVTTQEQDIVSTSTKKIPFTELLAQGGTYHCHVSQNLGANVVTGDVFIHKDRVKGHFTTSIVNKTIDTDIIVRDGYTYTWTPLMKGVGYKTKTVSNTETATDTPRMYSWNAETVGDYSCEDWLYTEETFDLPKDVTFTDLKQK